VIFGWLLLNEVLNWQQITGIVIILGGSLIICKNDAGKQ
jgi:drug/metabolite transporter (DMT)-like permease